MAFDPITAISEIGGKLIDRLWPDPAQREAAKVKLAELEASGELAKMANETETLKAYFADTASARDREVKIATAPDAPFINKVITPLLAIGVVTLTFIMFGVLVWIADGDLKPAQERILIFVVGAAVPICGQVISYYFGSSKGDAAKDQHLREMLKNGH